jgi:S1-C subfamily serine protease
MQRLRNKTEQCRRHKKMKVWATSLFLMVLFCVFLSGTLFAGKIYKWIDERGVVHFSDEPPDVPDKLKNTVEERDIKEENSNTDNQTTLQKISARSPIEFVINCTFTIKGTKKMGTGFFISSTGYAATCRHVVEESGNLTALMNDQQEYPLNVITMSSNYDLAIIQVMTSQKTPFLSIREAQSLIPGERVFAVGASAGLQSTVTDGVFTAFRKPEGEQGGVIQFSAPVNPGNSGGPLVDESGKVVGVVSQKLLAQRGIPISGVGFAVPSDNLKEEYSAYFE